MEKGAKNMNTSLRRSPLKSWEASFPANAETDSESLLFIKRLTFVTVSHILKLRGLLPVDSFKKRKLEGLSFHVLGSSTTLSSKASEIVKGACGAIDKKYLKELMLIVGDDTTDTEKALEVFTLSYTYSNDQGNELQIIDANGKPMGPPLQYKGMQTMRRQTALLIQRIVSLTATLEPLPVGCFASLKLTYYERTPPEYEPTCFTAFVGDAPYVFPKDNVETFGLGRVNTRYHCLQMCVESIFIENMTTCEERVAEHLEKSKAMNDTTSNSLSPQSVWNSMETPQKLDGGKRRRVVVEDLAPTVTASATEVGMKMNAEVESTDKENHPVTESVFKDPLMKIVVNEHENFGDFLSPYKSTIDKGARRMNFEPVRPIDHLEGMMAPLETSTPNDSADKDHGDKLRLLTSFFDKAKISGREAMKQQVAAKKKKSPLAQKNNDKKKSQSRAIVKSPSPAELKTNTAEAVPGKKVTKRGTGKKKSA